MKYMNIKEFRELGFVHEVNRLVLHPVGLALAIYIDENGEETLGGVWDYRDDPEGIVFDKDILNADKIERVASLKSSKIDRRIAINYEPERGVHINSEGIQIIMEDSLDN